MDPFPAVYSLSYGTMGIIKMYYFFYLSYWLRLVLMFVVVELNLDPGSDNMVRVLYSNIRGLHANLDELAAAKSDYVVLACAESRVSDRRHLSEIRIPGFGCPN